MAYSDVERVEAMIALAINKGDYDKTEKDTGVNRRTLIRWAKMSPKPGIPELLERAIERMLMIIPKNMDARDWSVALGILMDKWLLAKGLPTVRIENILSVLQSLPDEQLNELERQFVEAANSPQPDKG